MLYHLKVIKVNVTRLSVAVAACWAVAATAGAGDRPDVLPGPVPAWVVRVVDGDTVVVRARIWLDQDVTVPIRLAGVDAPERHARCERERQLADRAAAFATSRLSQGAKVELRDIRADKYGGRVLSRMFIAGGEDFGRILLEQGLARPYAGRQRAGWCDSASPGQR